MAGREPDARFPVDADGRIVYAALGAVTFIGAVLRVSYLGESMRWDEAKIVDWAHSWGIRQIATYYENVGNHILHTLAVDVSYRLFGAEPWSVRLPALIPGIALIPATYLTASALFSSRTALVAAGLVAGSPYLTFYSINSRGYMLQGLLVVLLLWLLGRLAKSPSGGLTLAAGIMGALALYTLPTTVFVMPGLYAGVALREQWDGNLSWQRAARRLVPALLITGALALVLYLPVFLVSGWEQISSNRFSAAQSAPVLWETFADRLVATAARWTWDLPAPVQALIAVVAALGLLDMARRRASSALLVALVVMTTLTVSLAIQRVPPVRGYLFLMPFFLVILAGGIQAALRWLPVSTRVTSSLVAVLLAIGGTMWTWSGGFLKAEQSNWRGRSVGTEEALRVLANVMSPRDTLVPYFVQSRFYARLHGLRIRHGDATAEDVENVYVLVRHRQETLQHRMESAGLDERSAEPRLFAVFPDLQVFVVPKKLAYLGGWYPEETASEATWRWTGPAATLSLMNPKTDSTFYLDYAARPHLFADAPQAVTISIGNQVLQSFVADATGRRHLRIPVPATALGAGDRLEIRIAVDRTFVPENAIAGSRDTRELGIQVYGAGTSPTG